ncbi:MAG TPA: dihydrofolate reductase family protein [Solirubrobacteraceae bacterium]|nr:dihydrofolate reductase family protein [Solirubrobacteraceae bacterium]
MEFRRLHPEPATVELLPLLAELRLSELAGDERPYVIANFVASADGRATLGGRSGPLGDDGDHETFHGLREQVDAVLAGTGTLRAEHYGRLVRTPERVERRVAHGLAPTPLMCIITRSGALPTDIPLLADPESTVVVYTGSPVEIDAAAAVEVVHVDPAELTPVTVFRRLRADHGVRSVLCEGGPTLFGALVHAQVVDELFLTVAPKLAGGGTGPPITVGAELLDPAELALAWVLERAGSLYLRYRLPWAAEPRAPDS